MYSSVLWCDAIEIIYEVSSDFWTFECIQRETKEKQRKKKTMRNMIFTRKRDKRRRKKCQRSVAKNTNKSDICGVIFSTEFIRKGFNKQFYSVFNFSSRQKYEISSQSLELIHCDAWGQLKTSNCSLREKKNDTKIIKTSKQTHFFRFITQSIVINIFFLICDALR